MTVDQLDGIQHGEEVDPTMDPARANALGAMAMSGNTDEKAPLIIPDPPDGSVTLPGGWLSPQGLVVRSAMVRELNGEDEEELARPGISRDFTKFIGLMLFRCVQSIGDEPVTKEMIDALLLGDREMLLQAIRVTTYGDTMRLNVVCPQPDCKHDFQVDYQFSVDVRVQQLEGMEVTLNSGEKITMEGARRTYRIPLRKGRSAEVNLIDGFTQRTVYTAENAERSPAELNTLLLQQCVQTIDGEHILPAHVRQMSSADRAQILQFLTDSQPGPQWEEVKQSCPRCDREFPLVIDVMMMFRNG